MIFRLKKNSHHNAACIGEWRFGGAASAAPRATAFSLLAFNNSATQPNHNMKNATMKRHGGVIKKHLLVEFADCALCGL